MSITSIVAAGRRLIATTLLDRARIQDRVLVPDGRGGKRETWVERPKSTNCRFVSPRDDDPIITLDSVFGRAEMVLEFPIGTVFHEGDRVRNLRDDVLWQIVLDVTVPSELQTVMRAGIKGV